MCPKNFVLDNKKIRVLAFSDGVFILSKEQCFFCVLFTRFFDGEKMHLDANSIIIAEGIHALNPKLTAHIDDSLKFRVYVSALTTLSLDNHNRIPTTDTRLIRRIVRDYRYRGYSAKDTIDRWPSVRRGEDKHIFPNQERADIMFNTAMVYETGVLKRYVEPILQQVVTTD